MAEHPPHRPAWITGLSARLLALTVLFVMLSEVLIYVPSISRFRDVALRDHIAKAHLAILALEATPDRMVSDYLEEDLLFHADAYSVVASNAGRKMRMLGDAEPPPVDEVVDLRDVAVTDMILETFEALARGENRILRVIGQSPRAPDTLIEVIIDETPLRRAMIDYSIRILTLSIIISLITASLVYLSLHWLMVRPMLMISECMTLFRENPEDDRATVPPTVRSDEIGVVMRELAAMQRDLRAALHQKTRLAALGGAMTKINHDLRNTLATAVLASDRLAGIDQPEVRRVAPQLYNAIARAVDLCGRTLDFARTDRPVLRPSAFALHRLIEDVAAASATGADAAAPAAAIEIDGPLIELYADREHFFRALSNLVLNAVRAGATRIGFRIQREEATLRIEVGDDGRGIPKKVQERLFQPFSGSSHDGGFGLGLVIAREIVTAHGGELKLARTDDRGTTFAIELPVHRIRAQGHAARNG
jgi:signal transduction histidine kinase